MKNMKKLLGVMTVLGLTSAAATTVVACGSTPNSGSTDQADVDQITTAFQSGVDGSKGLNTTNNQQDGANLLQTWAQTNVNNGATVTLTTSTELQKATDFLTAGDNTLSVMVTVGSANATVQAKITGVPAASDAQALAYLQTTFMNGIDGSTLSTSQHFSDGVTLLNNFAKTVKATATVTLTTASDATKVLQSGNNTIVVNITVGASVANNVSSKLTGITDADTAAVNTIKVGLMAGIDGSSLNTTNTYQDGLDLFNTYAITVNPSAKVAFVTASDANKMLVAGPNNNFNVTITVNTKNATITNGSLTGVTAATDLQKATAIKANLETGIASVGLDTTSTNANALVNLKNGVVNIDPNVNIALADESLLTNFLHSGDNTLSVNVTVGSTTLNANAKLTGVPAATDAAFVALIKAALQLGTTDPSLSTANTYADAVAVLNTRAKLFNSAATVTLVTPGDATKPLVLNNNNINVTIAVNSASDTATAVVTVVNAADQDKTQAQLIAAEFTNGVLGVPLTSLLNTQGDGLIILNVQAKLVNLGAIVQFVTPTDASKPLTTPTSTLNVTITVGDYTTGPVAALLTDIIL